MTDLQTFNNEEFGEIRTEIKNGEPWFVGKDVCNALGYRNSTVALQDNVDIEDKGVTKVSTLGGTQEAIVINESGLYALVFGSRLENAKRFKHWVTSEVLPSIRKTGSYLNQSSNLQLLQGMLDQMKQQEEEIHAAKYQSQQALNTTQAIKDNIIGTYDNWRESINHQVSVIQKYSGMTYQEIWNTLYDSLEKRGKCDLSIRVRNGRDRLRDSGATKTQTEAFGRLDVIEADARLKEIFTTIVKEYAIKYVA